MESKELINEPVDTVPGNRDADQPEKKKFVPPVISVPVDVLEATTFFQGVATGNVI